MAEILKFKKLSPAGCAPYKATPGAAGYDLSSARDYLIKPGGKKKSFFQKNQKPI